jgi:hypothetical protein
MVDNIQEHDICTYNIVFNMDELLTALDHCFNMFPGPTLSSATHRHADSNLHIQFSLVRESSSSCLDRSCYYYFYFEAQ